MEGDSKFIASNLTTRQCDLFVGLVQLLLGLFELITQISVGSGGVCGGLEMFFKFAVDVSGDGDEGV